MRDGLAVVEDAWNSGWVDAFKALLPESVVFRRLFNPDLGWHRGPPNQHDEILEFEREIDGTIAFADCEMRDALVRCHSTWENALTRAAGIEPGALGSTVSIGFKDGKVSEWHEEYFGRTAWGEALIAFEAWVAENHPEETPPQAAALFAAGDFAWSAENGKRALPRIQEWAATLTE